MTMLVHGMGERIKGQGTGVHGQSSAQVRTVGCVLEASGCNWCVLEASGCNSIVIVRMVWRVGVRC